MTRPTPQRHCRSTLQWDETPRATSTYVVKVLSTYEKVSSAEHVGEARGTDKTPQPLSQECAKELAVGKIPHVEITSACDRDVSYPADAFH